MFISSSQALSLLHLAVLVVQANREDAQGWSKSFDQRFKAFTASLAAQEQQQDPENESDQALALALAGYQ